MTKTTFGTWNNNTNPSWWKDQGLRRLALHICILYCCVFTFGYDGSLLNGLQTIPQWQSDFDYPAGSALGLIAASFYLPKILTPFLSSWIADRYGRRWALLTGSVISVAGGFVNAFANPHNRDFLIGGRVLLGAGLGMQSTIAPAMIQELCHPRMRAIAGAMYLCAFQLGSTSAAWICFGMVRWNSGSPWAWRIPTLLQVIGTAAVGVYIICGQLPESPRWQVSVGKNEEALRSIARMHANGDIDDELVQAEYAEICQGIAHDKLHATGYTAFLKTSGNRKRLIVIVVTGMAGQLNGVGLVSYYLVPILTLVGINSPTTQAGINGGLAMWNFFVILGAAQLVERVGRRPLWLIGSVGTLLMFSIQTGLTAGFNIDKNPTVGTAVIPFLFFFYLFYDIAWATLANLYTAEILPFGLRSKGQSLYVVTQSCSLAFNQYVNPVALAAISWRYYFVFIAVQAVLVVFAYFFYVETKGLTIEEVSRLFDGKNATERQQVVDHVSAAVAYDRKDHDELVEDVKP